MFIAMDPKGRYLYMLTYNGISAFRIASTGELIPISKLPLGNGEYSSLLVGPTGKFVFLAAVGSSSDPYAPPPPSDLLVFRIGSDGALTPVPGSPFMVGILPVCLATDRSGQFLYVGNIGDNSSDNGGSYAAWNIYGYKVGPEGVLSQLAGSPFGVLDPNISPQALVADPRGNYLYEVGSFLYPPPRTGREESAALVVYQIAADGALIRLPTPPLFLNPGESFGATAVAKNNFLYTVISGYDTSLGGTISRYRIDSQGLLIAIPASSFTTPLPTALAVDPLGRFLYSGNSGNTTISEYMIGAGGALTPIPGSPFNTNLPIGYILATPTAPHP